MSETNSLTKSDRISSLRNNILFLLKKNQFLRDHKCITYEETLIKKLRIIDNLLDFNVDSFVLKVSFQVLDSLNINISF